LNNIIPQSVIEVEPSNEQLGTGIDFGTLNIFNAQPNTTINVQEPTMPADTNLEPDATDTERQ
jgi:hypothetical protein